MALAAGRVGVAPDQVDNNGHIIGGGGGGSVDAYTKSETNALLATKADQSNLTANSKDFVFAYSNGQYGYKAGSTGTFHPFEEAGVTSMGWVKPAELSSEGLTFGSGLEYVSGGYAIMDQKMVYVDLIYRRTATGSAAVGGLPKAAQRHSGIAYTLQELPGDIFEFFHSADAADFTMSAVNDGTNYVKYTDNNSNLYYRRLIAQYPWFYEPSQNRSEDPIEENTRSITEEEPIKEPTEEEPSEEIKTTTKKSTRRKS